MDACIKIGKTYKITFFQSDLICSGIHGHGTVRDVPQILYSAVFPRDYLAFFDLFSVHTEYLNCL